MLSNFLFQLSCWCGSACDKAAGSKFDTCLICMYCSKTLPEAWWLNYLNYLLHSINLVKAVSVQRDTDVGTFRVSVLGNATLSFFLFFFFCKTANDWNKKKMESSFITGVWITCEGRVRTKWGTQQGTVKNPLHASHIYNWFTLNLGFLFIHSWISGFLCSDNSADNWKHNSLHQSWRAYDQQIKHLMTVARLLLP